jgi:hypothetical protein
MPRPPIDLARKIKDILLHTEPLPDEARSPILHNESPGLLVPADLADRISTAFQIDLQVAGSVGVVV